jgi:hypothetical protein
MDQLRFRVVFTGRLAPGLCKEEVSANLAKMCGFTPRALESFFSGTPVVRSGVDRKAAWRCWELFRRAGALCQVESLEQEGLSGNGPSPVDVPFIDNTCPCCNALQHSQVICARCGVDMALYALAPNLH